MLRKILIAGYYGFNNTGDEAILAGMLVDMRSLRQDLEFVVISGNPIQTSTLHNVRSVHWKDLDQIVAAAKECDLYLLGGGGLFHDYWGVNPEDLLTENSYGIAYYAGTSYLASLTNKPCVLYSVGIGPLNSPEAEQMTRMTADLCSLITVRDVQSKECLVQLGISSERISVGSDPAFRLPADLSFGQAFLAGLRSPLQKPIIGVSIRPWDLCPENPEWKEIVANALDEMLIELGGTVLLIPFQRDDNNDPLIDDYSACLTLRNMMVQKENVTIFSDQATPGQIAGIISQCDLLIGMRLHSLIFAASTGVPFVAIEYDPKINMFISELDLVDYSISLNEMNKGNLSSRIQSAWQNREQIKTKLRKAVSSKQSVLLETARNALDLLEHPPKHSATTIDLESLTSFSLRQTYNLGKKESSVRNLQKVNASLQNENVSLQNENNSLQKENGFLQQEVYALSGQISRIKKSRSFKLAQRIMRTRTLIMPEGSRREYYARNFWRDLLLVRKEGLASVVRKWSRWFTRKIPKSTEGSALNGKLPFARKRDYTHLKLLPQIQAKEITDVIDILSEPTKPLKPDVVCFSIIKWDFRYQRPQQMMSQFSENGHRVFYIDIVDFLPAGSQPKYKLSRIKENVYQLSLAAQRSPDVYGEVIEGDNLDFILESLEQLRQKLFLNDVIGYVMIASWGVVALETQRRWGWRIIYDCMDEWDTFPLIKQPILQVEKKLVQGADLLVVTAKKLYEKWQPYGSPTVIARNGVDFEYFHSHLSENDLLQNLHGPVIGYYGAIADWFDLELLQFIADQRPEYQFVLLGGVFDVDVSYVQSLPNVHLLGQQPYELMPKYLFNFDVCIIPFKINAVTQATDPVKLYEYLSAGKPVVSVNLSEISIYRDLLYIANNQEDFVTKLDQAVQERNPDLCARRVELARNNTWKKRYDIVEKGLASVTPKASIIIVTYNNLMLNKLCLESVYSNTDYPNYEVIVVDNNSSDGTQEYLVNFQKKRTDLKLILNESNNGFARANNQGLAIAEGQYLVMLNNDTVVPPGWLTRLTLHLKDECVGLVGPVTNFAGNEARIPVMYTTWEEMELFANEHIWQYEGQAADIHVLAMFCLAFRKDAFLQIGELDEGFGIGMFEDDDYAQRARQKGLRTICALDSFVHHVGQASFKKLIRDGSYDPLFEMNKARYEKKWQTIWSPHTHGSLPAEKHSIPFNSKDGKTFS